VLEHCCHVCHLESPAGHRSLLELSVRPSSLWHRAV